LGFLEEESGRSTKLMAAAIVIAVFTLPAVAAADPPIWKL
jgi:hypothetical protein